MDYAEGGIHCPTVAVADYTQRQARANIAHPGHALTLGAMRIFIVRKSKTRLRKSVRGAGGTVAENLRPRVSIAEG